MASVQLAVMEVAEAPSERLLTSGGDNIVARCRSDHGAPPNDGDVVLQSQTDGTTDCSSMFQNHSSSMNDDDDDWTRRRPESIWLDYLYAWNPLAAGIVKSHNNRSFKAIFSW